MKTKKILLGLSMLAGVCAAAPSASAEPPKKKDGSGYEYKFEDDGLLGKDLGGNTPVITMRPKGARVPLLRPRVQFVQEMLKSVENL